MADVRTLVFEEWTNMAPLTSGGGGKVPYETIGKFSDPAKPLPAAGTNRFYLTAVGAGITKTTAELNNLFVNDAGGLALTGYFFLGFDAHDIHGRARLAVTCSSTAPVVGKYPTMNQVRFRGWEQVIVPTDPPPTHNATEFVSWEQNPIVDPRERLALTDYLAGLTAVPVQLGVALPGAGNALIGVKLIPRRGLSFILTAEFDFDAKGTLP